VNAKTAKTLRRAAASIALIAGSNDPGVKGMKPEQQARWTSNQAGDLYIQLKCRWYGLPWHKRGKFRRYLVGVTDRTRQAIAKGVAAG